jgi:undecaprenyl pyrophosphate synthase
MKAKIGTALDRDLLRRARLMAKREGKRLNQVIEEALSEHLIRRTSPKDNIVAKTAGSLKISNKELKQILEEEPGIFDR